MEGLRDRDPAARARLLKVVLWTLFPALFMGGAVWFRSGFLAGAGAFLLVSVSGAGGALALTELAARAAGRLVHPSTGHRHREFSGPAALAARGLHADAVAAYEALAREFPEDPEPCLGAARICGGPLEDVEAALRWFRTARRRGLSEGGARIVIREIVEAAERSGNGLLAAPDLARHADEHEGTDEGRWARDRLRGLKAGMRRDGSTQDPPPVNEGQ
ncbi:MAG: hypothetical protein RQ751_04695 [Longimicrobiales bacterium]|nr:hypothetical protein [Longimicrobiales bacterium]